ncbi:hypothetical protein ACP275_09G101400 [Erythranthe tilingii]
MAAAALLVAAPPPSKAKPFQFTPNSPKFTQNKNLKNGFFPKGKLSNTKRAAAPIASLSANPPPENGKASRSGGIWLSDVAVRRRRSVYWGREWNSLDVATLGVVVVMHLLCFWAPLTFNRNAVMVALGLYIMTGLFGITLSFHRNLSHRSFKLPKWLEYFFAYCGVQALQGNPIDWVSTHRYHHQFCDSEKDPHSPVEGFWFSHMSWLFDTKAIAQRVKP